VFGMWENKGGYWPESTSRKERKKWEMLRRKRRGEHWAARTTQKKGRGCHEEAALLEFEGRITFQRVSVVGQNKRKGLNCGRGRRGSTLTLQYQGGGGAE